MFVVIIFRDWVKPEDTTIDKVVGPFQSVDECRLWIGPNQTYEIVELSDPKQKDDK